MTNNTDQFDVFFAYNSADKELVGQLATKLKLRGRRVWLDTEQIPPGRWFQDVIQQGLQRANSIAVFLGPSGLGRFQAIELRTAIDHCLQKEIPVIPVLLPGSEFPEGLLFLKQLNWVRVTSARDDSAIDNLDWGVVGKTPELTIHQLHSVQARVDNAHERCDVMAARADSMRRWHRLTVLALVCVVAIVIYQFWHIVDLRSKFSTGTEYKEQQPRVFAISKLDSGDWIGLDTAARSLPDRYAPIANLTVELTNTGKRPVVVLLMHKEPTEPESDNYVGVGSKSYLAYRLRLVRDGSHVVGEYKINVGGQVFIPAAMVQFIDNPDAGQHIYSLEQRFVGGEGALYLSGLRLVAYEL